MIGALPLWASTTKDPPYRGAIHVKPVESSNILPLMEVGVPAQVSPEVTMVQNIKSGRNKVAQTTPKALV
ncbi:hypothetical protein TNCV_3308091 [Trichonephila clavipes]|nr:hypothetical protein TNCV_3308091 [Trichonephila clavipes]